MTTAKKAAHREPMSESETLRVDLERTRQHLAGTVQELSRRLNVQHRMKETAGQAGQTMKQTAGQAGQTMKQVPAATKDLGMRHPKATAAIGGAVAVGAGAAVWIARRHR